MEKRTLQIYLIRHGRTEGNQKKRYIGTTDEPLCREGIWELENRQYPHAQIWLSSPLRRCLQTAKIIAAAEPEIVPDFRECDFGLFENKNYLELADCPEYQAWIDSGGMLPFPGGESREVFTRRSCRAFEEKVDLLLRNGYEGAGMVVHGGTIMSVMERFARPQREYYQWHTENGGGYQVTVEEQLWHQERIFAGWQPFTGENAGD